MTESRYARSFRELVVYRKCRAVSQKIFELSKSFPKEETFSLTDKIRRAVRSIGAQVAKLGRSAAMKDILSVSFRMPMRSKWRHSTG